MVQNLKSKVIYILGPLCLVLSSLFLFVSTHNYSSQSAGSEVYFVLWLTIARLWGIGAFLTGVFAIINSKWTIGTLLLLGSVGLPVISLLTYGRI